VLPVLHLDHIYYDHDLIVDRVVLHKTMKALVASDHLPLYADFVVREEAKLDENGRPFHSSESVGNPE
jgi:hypothetical protein